MRLDDLKTSWNLYTNELVSKSEVQEIQIKSLLKSRANDIVSKIKKSLYFEITLVILCSAIFLTMLFEYSDPVMMVISYVMLIFSLGSMVFLTYYYRKINLFDMNLPNLKDSLGGVITSLKGYIRVYNIINVCLAPLMFTSGLYYGFFIGAEAEEQNTENQASMLTGEQILMVVFIYIIAFIAFYFLSKFYIHKLYGIHLKSLKGCLAELEGFKS
ncbi:MAG: hypothetical protein CMO01_27035 [Thalassobius sp.]|nr:hypothetical protein [Thalassovita sp.]